MSDCKFCDWKNPKGSDTSILGMIMQGQIKTHHLLEHLIELKRKGMN